MYETEPRRSVDFYRVVYFFLQFLVEKKCTRDLALNCDLVATSNYEACQKRNRVISSNVFFSRKFVFSAGSAWVRVVSLLLMHE